MVQEIAFWRLAAHDTTETDSDKNWNTKPLRANEGSNKRKADRKEDWWAVSS